MARITLNTGKGTFVDLMKAPVRQLCARHGIGFRLCECVEGFVFIQMQPFTPHTH